MYLQNHGQDDLDRDWGFSIVLPDRKKRSRELPKALYDGKTLLHGRCQGQRAGEGAGVYGSSMNPVRITSIRSLASYGSSCRKAPRAPSCPLPDGRVTGTRPVPHTACVACRGRPRSMASSPGQPGVVAAPGDAGVAPTAVVRGQPVAMTAPLPPIRQIVQISPDIMSGTPDFLELAGKAALDACAA